MSASEITIFAAKKIITMCPNRPETTHVAVRGDRILGTGTLEELTGFGEYQLDETFADKVLMPGLIEAHSHVTGGGMWQFPMWVTTIARTIPVKSGKAAALLTTSSARCRRWNVR
jgi:predicted amidohydrolase YtcJ